MDGDITTLIEIAFKHFLYTLGINLLFDKLIENFPSSKYDFVVILFDDIQIGDTIISVDKYDENPVFVYGGTVSKINDTDRSILYKTPLVCSEAIGKWTEVQVVLTFSDDCYEFVKRIQIH